MATVYQYALALPQYGFSSARLCDNCHSWPFETKTQKAWLNPPIKERKCNMSCLGCHINPAGGGLRNGPGRYFAMSTLPSFHAKGRPYRDSKNREIKNILAFLKNQPEKSFQKIYVDSTKIKNNNPSINTSVQTLSSLNNNQNSVHNAKQNITPNTKSKERKIYYPSTPLSLGHPFGTEKKQSTYAYSKHRYGKTNVDPFISLGGDARLGYWNAAGAGFIFPMQFELSGAIHPVEHITFMGTTALQGRTKGFKASAQDSENNPLKMQNAFILIHELPYMIYLQGGWFLPEFGTRVDDHTLYQRKYLEMDPSIVENTVRGIQFGLAPNYPYFSASLFETRNVEDEYTGNGGTMNVAWRDISWGAGTSLMGKYRPFSDQGDMWAISLNGYFNVWGLWPKLRYTHPILWQTDYTFGKKDRTIYNQKKFQAGWMQFDYQILNGINLKLNYSFYDADFELKDDFVQRIGFGFDWTFFPGLRFTFEPRITLPESGSPSPDLITFIHGYL